MGILRRTVNRVLDLDIQKFFDMVDHDWMLRFLHHRVGDPRIVRLVRQWLEVGQLEQAGRQMRATRGMPQGR